MKNEAERSTSIENILLAMKNNAILQLISQFVAHKQISLKATICFHPVMFKAIMVILI